MFYWVSSRPFEFVFDFGLYVFMSLTASTLDYHRLYHDSIVFVVLWKCYYFPHRTCALNSNANGGNVNCCHASIQFFCWLSKAFTISTCLQNNTQYVYAICLQCRMLNKTAARVLNKEVYVCVHECEGHTWNTLVKEFIHIKRWCAFFFEILYSDVVFCLFRLVNDENQEWMNERTLNLGRRFYDMRIGFFPSLFV